MTLDNKFFRADEFGIRLEIVGGLHIWEAQPLYKHQKHVARISQNIRKTEKAEHNNPTLCVTAIKLR